MIREFSPSIQALASNCGGEEGRERGKERRERGKESVCVCVCSL